MAASDVLVRRQETGDRRWRLFIVRHFFFFIQYFFDFRHRRIECWMFIFSSFLLFNLFFSVSPFSHHSPLSFFVPFVLFCGCYLFFFAFFAIFCLNYFLLSFLYFSLIGFGQIIQMFLELFFRFRFHLGQNSPEGVEQFLAFVGQF